MSWLRSLVRDVLWAKAHVLVKSGYYKTRPAWRYLRSLADEITIPPELLALARGHYAEPEPEPPAPREANLDGELHVERECCGEGSIMGRACRQCGGRAHQQPVYGGIAEVCEACPCDADYWYPRGTYTSERGHNPAAAGSFV